MAEPPPVVVEMVGWGGIDPLPELPLFHTTAEDSCAGPLYFFGEQAIFWPEGWRASVRYHWGDGEVPVQKTPVLARFRSFLVRLYGENWEAMVWPESGKVLLFELRAILARWLGISMEQREEFALAMDSWSKAVFRVRVRSLVDAGGSLCLEWATPDGSDILHRRLSSFHASPWEVISCIGIAHSKNCTNNIS